MILQTHNAEYTSSERNTRQQGNKNKQYDLKLSGNLKWIETFIIHFILCFYSLDKLLNVPATSLKLYFRNSSCYKVLSISLYENQWRNMDEVILPKAQASPLETTVIVSSVLALWTFRK